MRAVRTTHIQSEALPVANLSPSEPISLRLAHSSRQGVALDVLELCGELSDNPGFARGLELWQRQTLTNERFPITHR